MNALFKCQSLRCRVLLLVTVFIFFIISFGYLFLSSYYEKLKLQNNEYLRTYAHEKTKEIENYLLQRQSVLEYFVDNNQALGEHFQEILSAEQTTQTPKTSSVYKELDRKIKYIFEHFELYDIFVISQKGDILYTYKKESDLGKNLNTSDLKETHFAELFNDSKTLMQTLRSPLEYYEPSQAEALFYVSPLYYEKRYCGVLAIQIDVNTMMDAILNDISSLREHGEVHIARMTEGHQHELIYSHSHNAFSDTDKSDLELFLNSSDVMTHSYISPFDSVESLAEFIPSLKIDLILKADSEDIFSEFNFIRSLSIGFLLFILFCSVILLYIFYGQILRPIRKLNAATGSLAKGDYDVSIDLHRNDEMSALADNFNDMGRQIKQRARQLEIKSADLSRLLKNFDKHVISSKTDTKGILTYVSEAFCKINGYSKEEIIGLSQNIGRHPDMPKSLFKELWKTVSAGKQWHGEIRNLTKDGSAYWADVLISPDFDEEGKIIGYSAIRHDITAQKELEALTSTLERKVQQRTGELNRAQEIGKIGHWKIDLRSKALTWSDEVYRIMGLPPQLVPQTYKGFLKFIHPDDRKKVNSAYFESVRKNTPYRVKHRIMQKGDGIRYVEEIGEHTTDESGKVIASFGTIHDITELTLVQLELERINDNLEIRIEEALEGQKMQQKHLMQQSKMAAMGEMISMIAHQWRQPLSAIAATIMGIKVELELDKFKVDTLDNTLDDVNGYIQHMSHTIDDFRNFFRSDKKAEQVNINTVIDTTLELIRLGLASNNICIVKHYHVDTPLFTYKNELIQVLINLFKNAQDNFIEKQTVEPTIEIRTYEQENMHVIEFCDNGGGIPEAYLDRIFEPYFSTKDEKNGTGLGLYMSKTIIDEHCQGSLHVRNEKGGAKFTIKLTNITVDYVI